MSNESARRIWSQLDELVAEPDHSSPWSRIGADLEFVPDFNLLGDLLWVPIAASAPISSGLHAKALDVWLARELRRAGFPTDEVWPRPSPPRVLPREVGLLLESLSDHQREQVLKRLRSGIAGVGSADAVVLGSAYRKQVDVVIAQWSRGPEVLISTKSMHSSLANNALNRIEESFGDAHNLRGRYPQAAIGYVLLIRAAAIRASQRSAERLIDLVGRLGKDPLGYDAAAVVVADWRSPAGEDPGSTVELLEEFVPADLHVGRFIKVMVETVLERTPVDDHVQVRERHG